MDKINGFETKFHIEEDVVKALNIMGYLEPMPVQEAVMMPILQGEDLIVQSKTGSGKTAAFGIPIVNQLVVEENSPQVLVLTPTRELAVQVCEEIAQIGRYKKIRCLPIYGKQPIHIQLRQLKQRVHVAVGTPGRVSDLIRKKHLDLSQIQYLVIDEADELLKRGFLEEVEGIIEKVPTPRTTLLFSATMPPEIEAICANYMTNPTRFEIESEETPIEQIKQTWYEVADDWKLTLVSKLLVEKQPYTCIVFCKTRDKVDQVNNQLTRAGFITTALHGQMPQKIRLNAIRDFKDGKVQVLVATDLAARGIHIDKLDLVINYNIPFEPENYVHRIGRTGRVGEKGEAISLVNVHETKQWAGVIDFIGYQVPKASDELLRGTDNHLPNGKKKLGSTKKSAPTHKTKEAQVTKPKKRELPLGTNKHRDISRIRINIGKKKKVRPGDILGAVSNLSGITSEDIGIIDIQETCSYVEIFNNKGDLVLESLPKSKVKGKTITTKRVSNRV